MAFQFTCFKITRILSSVRAWAEGIEFVYNVNPLFSNKFDGPEGI